MNDRIRVFVASSSEQIATAQMVADSIKAADQKEKKPMLEVYTWQEGVFSFSSAYIESLENELDRADFAIVVLTADDSGSVRKTEVNLPRDNVIFELGLFAGRLGRKRCFFFIDGESDTKIASDLSGVKPVKFYENTRAEDAGKPSLKYQSEIVRYQMLQLGPRYKPSRQTRALQEERWRFCSRIEGAWWERMRTGEDAESALSYVSVTVDELTNTPRLEGKSYNKEGTYLAEWKSVVSGVELSGSKPKVSYRWEGEFDEAIGQKYGGGGRFEFDDWELNTARGYFYDTNYALLKSNAKTTLKRFGLYRCQPHEVETMRSPWSEEASTLIRKKLSTLRGR
jgi:hypothetical protein